METLKLDKKTAIKLYPTAAPEFKTMLETTFGTQTFSGKITDRVKTFKDACEVLGTDPDTAIPEVATGPLQQDEQSIWAYCKLIIIARALNEGWTPDWKNSNQEKYYPWFKMSSGSGLSFGDTGCDDSRTYVSSRLCFKTRELAEYAAKQFEDIYTEFFIIK